MPVLLSSLLFIGRIYDEKSYTEAIILSHSPTKLRRESLLPHCNQNLSSEEPIVLVAACQFIYLSSPTLESNTFNNAVLI